MRPSKSLLLGIIGACVCAGCVFAYMGVVGDEAEAARAEALERYGGDQIEVCVAKRTIAQGETISEAAVETKLWVAELLPEGAVKTTDEAVGKQTNAAIYAGEPILTSRLGQVTTELDIPEGMTAVSVPARTVQAVGGALSAGMCVDVYATGASGTTLLLTGSLVLATNSEGLGSNDTAWIVLAVEPEQVQELVSAAENLELSFALPEPAKEA